MTEFKRLHIRNSILKFWISYSIVLLLPLFLCMIGYQAAFDIVEKDIKDKNLSMMKYSISMLDGQFKSLNTMAMQIASSPQVSAAVEIESRINKSLYLEATKSIDFLAETLNFSHINIYKNLYIYLGNTDYVVTSVALYQAPFYYEYVLKEQENTFEEWKGNILEGFKYADNLTFNDMSMYVQSIPIIYNRPVTGAVIATLNKDEILHFFDYVEIDKGAYLYIQDMEGNIILENSSGKEPVTYMDFRPEEPEEGVLWEKLSGEDKIVVYARSEVNDWRYTLVLPERVIMHKLLNLQRLILIIFTSALGIGVIISLYMAVKTGKPLNKLINELRKGAAETELPSGCLDNIENMGDTVSKIISRNKLLKDELEKQQPLLQTVFFQKLVRGEFTNEKEMQALAQRADLHMASQRYIIVAFRVFSNNDFYDMDTHTLEEVNVISLLIRNKLKAVWKQSPYFYEVDYLTTAVIIGMEDKSAEGVYEAVKAIHNEIVEEYKINPLWGISKSCDALLKLWRAYEEAKNALMTGTPGEAALSVVPYETIEDNTTAASYYYPPGFGQRLINCTKAGDIKNTVQLLKLLHTENFEKRRLSPDSIKKLLNEMNSTLIKLTHCFTEKETEVFEKLHALTAHNTIIETELYMQEVMRLYTTLGTYFARAKQKNQTKLIHKIVNFIEREYMNPNLCLSMVAAEFNISGGYISSLFKSQTNVNFIDYVENLRISKACSLLRDSGLSVNDIGKQVGYNSVQSFRRAFKRIKGVSPSEIRI